MGIDTIPVRWARAIRGWCTAKTQWNVSTCIAAALLLSSTSGSLAAPPDVSRGLSWLASQVQPDGNVAGSVELGHQQQARCEVAATLAKLSGPSAHVSALLTALQSEPVAQATELLACAQSVRQQLGDTFLASEVDQRRVSQQGYAAYPEVPVTSAVDTGWALAAQLRNLSGPSKDSLLAWLQSSQAADGSFAVGGRPDLLATAAVVRGLGTEVSTRADAAAIASKAAVWLLSRRHADGHWAGDGVLTSLVFEAVHPYSAADSTAGASVEAYLLALQQPDGSWLGDAYTTAVALRALSLTGVPALDPTRSGLKIRFTDARTGTPVPGVQLTSTSPAVLAQSDAGGAIQLAGLPPAAYQFSTTAAGYASVSLSATLVAGQTLELGAVQLIAPADTSTATVSGTVREQGSNSPVAGASVVIEGRGQAATTAGDGSYLIANVAPGTVTLTASKAGYLAASGTGQPVAGQVLNFSPWLVADAAAGAAGCRIQGLVLDAQSQQPLAGVTVSTSGANTVTATTGADGRYATGDLVSGLTLITAAKSGYDSVLAQASISCSTLQPTVGDFSPRLYPTNQSPPDANTAGMAGVVMDAATNAPIAGAQLLLTPSAGAAKSATSAADGSFGFQGLDSASVELKVQADGYQGVTMTYALTPLQTLEVGQVRLRAPKVEQLMADLKVVQVQRGTARTDAQTLQLQGQVQVMLANGGTQQTAAQVPLTAFEDVNSNGRFDAGTDAIMGTALLAQSLPPAATATVSIEVQGAMAFRDAPVHVIADPSSAQADANRDNNVGSTAQQALAQPQVAAFNPKLKWEWFGGSGPLPTWDSVEMTPISIPTRDTNGDGKVDAKDTPTVIASFFDGVGRRHDVWPAVVRAFDGKTGALLATSSPSQPVFTMAHLAGADIDADGAIEILGITVEGRLAAFRGADLSVKWISSHSVGDGVGGPIFSAPAIVDLDGDGLAEILVANAAFNHDGSLRWVAPSHLSPNCSEFRACAPVVTGLNGPDDVAVVYGNAVLNADGSVRWHNGSVSSGEGVVAQFGPNLSPGVAIVGQDSRVTMLNSSGSRVWGPLLIPLSSGVRCYKRGGPPVVGDFDGDGVADLGIASCDRYIAFRSDGSVLWSRVLDKPDESGFTGSTLFDFDGDGIAEVIYANEFKMYVLRAQDGAIVFETANFSGTAMEYPIVADVDLDGSADIIIGGNRYHRSGSGLSSSNPMRGLRVLQDINNAWVGVRSIWNQHAYHIDNINDDLTVPRVPVQSWKTHNTFRLNKRIDGDPRAVPDLTVGYLRVADGGSAGSVLTVRVGNTGSYAVPANTLLAVYSSDPAQGTPTASALVATATVAAVLQPGQWRDVQIPVARDLASLNALGQIWIVGDDDGTGKHAIQDFDRSNNTHQGDLPVIAANLIPTVTTDKPTYTEADVAFVTAGIRNAGSFGRDTAVRFTVLDAAGQVVEVLPLSATVSVPAAGTTSVAAPWPVSGILAGSYVLKAELISPAGLIYGAATTTFAVTASQQQSALARITTDRASYSAAQAVQLSSRVGNATGNTVLESVQAATEVFNPGGASVYRKIEAIDQLAPAGTRHYGYSLPASGLAAGSYQARLQLLSSTGSVLAQSTTSFVVLGADQTGVGLTGTLQASPATLFVGRTSQLQLAATNNSASALANVPLTVRVIDPESGSVVATFSSTVESWQPGQTHNLSYPWVAVGNHGQTLVAAASAQLAGKETPLGQTNLKVLHILYSGTLAADPVEVEAGSDVALNYSVANPAPVAGHMTGTLAVQTQAAQPLASWPLTLDIEAGSSFAGNQLYTTGEEQQTLTAVLSQQLGTSSVVLTTASFTIVDAPAPVSIDTSARAAARILVLVSCPPGLGAQEDAACVAQRSQAIHSYLTTLGYSAKTVSTGQAFWDELRCGTYNTYWLSGGAVKLDHQAVGELKTAITRGEALWMDGVHDSRNQLLHEVAGVQDIGKLSVRDQVAQLAEAGLYGAGQLPTLGQPGRFSLTTGQAQGLFAQTGGNQGPVPAVVSNDWASGKSLLWAFDLAGMVTADAVAANGQLAAFVSASGSHAQSGSPTLTVGDITQLAASVTNQGSRTVSFKAEATLPVGLTSISTQPAAQLTTNTDGSSTASWSFTLDGGKTQQIGWTVKAAQAGSYSVPLQVYSLPRAGSTAPPKLRAEASIEVQVHEGSALVQQAQVEVNAIQPTANSDKQDKTKAVNAVAPAQSLHAQGNYEQAIVQWLAAADALARIGSADTTQAQKAVALAIEASTDALCIQKCGSAGCQ